MVSEAAAATASGGEQKQKDGQGAGDQEAELMDFAFGSSMVLEGDDVTSVKARTGVRRGGGGYYACDICRAEQYDFCFVMNSSQKGMVECSALAGVLLYVLCMICRIEPVSI